MKDALWQALGRDLSRADALVMAAAVGDYRAAEPRARKMKKDGERLSIELVKNPDVLAEVGGARRGRRPVIVGFAVETEGDEELARSARAKLASKGADLIVANAAADAFGRDDNRAILVSADKTEPLTTLSKGALADILLDRVAELWRAGA